MTSASSQRPTSTLSNFEALFDAALDKYKKRTGKDLRNHPLAAIIDRCDSPNAILTIFQEQSRAFDEFRNGNRKLIKFLDPIVDGLQAISNSAVLSAGASLAYPPAQMIFSGIGVLLSTAKYVRASYDTLVDVFESIENFTRRLIIYADRDIERTPAMTETINQGRLKKFARKLLGEQEIESILQRLDRLTLEESKITVAQTLDVVHGLVNNIETVMEDGKTSTDDIQQTLVLLQELAVEVHKMKRDQLQEKVRRWLSAPDPWTNHNIARKAHYRGTATWFIQGDVFTKWKSTGSFLWIYGHPGSGKTVLSSSIIEELHYMRQVGLATISFFYFDFRDGGKQNARHLLSTLLIQLCDQSNKFSEVLSTLFSAHGHGSRQPSEEALMECLRTMLKLSGQGTHYLVIDALDECPDSSGCPTLREQVLIIMKGLIDLQLPHVHFCITSRPEIDIRGVLEPLATHKVPLHEQFGQNQDIVDYINDLVRSDPRMRRWREEDKQLVIKTLIEKAGGMFRWVHCQLETLRRCFPSSIRILLGELPKTLDETYDRILLGIDAEKRPFAHRLLQCLVISIRPLRVEELAELFAIFPNSDSTPSFNVGWRPEDPEAFVLSACSTLVAIVKVYGEKVVQFSHFSVREYLTSDRIVNAAPVSHFHILPKPAHTLLARACLSTLLQLSHTVDETKLRDFPLASYAAEHWVNHARFEDVSRDILDEMDRLFDCKKPHLATWTWLYDVENCQKRYGLPPHPTRPDAVPLYYAALCGFRDLSERLLNAHPQDLNAWGGRHGTPLHAAVDRGHLDTVLLLLERGADVESRGRQGHTGLYLASSRGHAEVVWSLIDCGADPNAECADTENALMSVKWTPLLVASQNRRLEVVRVLLERGADVNYTDNWGKTALHLTWRHPSADLAQSLLQYGANINALDYWGRNALHRASCEGQIAVVTVLLNHGANVAARTKSGWTPLHEAARWGHPEITRLLLDHGADTEAQTEDHHTALHLAVEKGHDWVVKVLLERGADPHSRDRCSSWRWGGTSGSSCDCYQGVLASECRKWSA